MSRLLAFLARSLTSSRPAGRRAGVARQLMERAEASAGASPQHARELRRAAFAYLSVIR